MADYKFEEPTKLPINSYFEEKSFRDLYSSSVMKMYFPSLVYYSFRGNSLGNVLNGLEYKVGI